MQRAGRVLRRLKLAGESVAPEDLVRAAWAPAVGSQIARHSRVLALRGGRLVIEVEEPLWQQNLELFRRDILRNLAEVAGPGLVETITIRLGAPRIQPRREEGTRASADEADRIADPVFRKLYRESRNRNAG